MDAKYEYECLKLGDADAIVICHYFMNGNQEFPFLILIDSGKEKDGKFVAAHLSEYYGTKHINLAYVHIRIVIIRMAFLIYLMIRM